MSESQVVNATPSPVVCIDPPQLAAERRLRGEWQTVDLPRPISTNELFANGKKGRYKTARYATWLQAAGWILRARQPKLRRIADACEVHIILCREWRGDIDNALKGLLDALQTFGVITNDKLVSRITIERGDVEGSRVSIREIAE